MLLETPLLKVFLYSDFKNSCYFHFLIFPILSLLGLNLLLKYPLYTGLTFKRLIIKAAPTISYSSFLMINYRPV